MCDVVAIEETQSGPRELLERFIEAYRNEPCLWQTKSKDYHDRKKKDSAYKRLLAVYKRIDAKATRDTLVKRINNLRSSYRKELNKMRASEKLGTDEIYTPKLWYFKLFNFLNEEPIRTSTSSLFDEDDHEENPWGSPDEATQFLQFSTIKKDPHSSQETDVETTPGGQQPTKRRKVLSDEVYMNASDDFKRPKTSEDRFDFYAKSISMKLRELPKEQRIIAEKIINDALFLAETESLTLSHFISGPEFVNTASIQSQDQLHNQFPLLTHHANSVLPPFYRSRRSSASSLSNFSTDD